MEEIDTNDDLLIKACEIYNEHSLMFRSNFDKVDFDTEKYVTEVAAEGWDMKKYVRKLNDNFKIINITLKSLDMLIGLYEGNCALLEYKNKSDETSFREFCVNELNADVESFLRTLNQAKDLCVKRKEFDMLIIKEILEVVKTQS